MPKGKPKLRVQWAALKVLEELPRLTTREIYELMDDAHRPPRLGDLSSALSNAMKAGKVKGTRPAHGDKRGLQYTLIPNDERTGPERKLKEPTEAGLKATCDELRAKVVELQDWKADAIKRYPDLAVSDLVKRARDIVAKRLRARGDVSGATAVEAGYRDETAIVQAVIDTLEEADAG